MDISKLKVSLSILLIIVAQGAGLVWYIAQMDASINALQKDMSRLETSYFTLSESTRDLSKITLLEQQVSLLETALQRLNIEAQRLDTEAQRLETEAQQGSAIYSEVAGALENLDSRQNQFDGNIKGISTTLEAAIITLEANRALLEPITEDNVLITLEILNERLQRKAQKAKTNRLLTENSDRLGVIETWRNDILEAERIAEEKKQAKKDKKKDK